MAGKGVGRKQEMEGQAATGRGDAPGIAVGLYAIGQNDGAAAAGRQAAECSAQMAQTRHAVDAATDAAREGRVDEHCGWADFGRQQIVDQFAIMPRKAGLRTTSALVR